MVEKARGLVAHGQDEFRCKRADHRTAQGDPCARFELQWQLFAVVLTADSLQDLDVDDGIRSRSQRRARGKDVLALAASSSCLGQPDVEAGQGVMACPENRQAFGAVGGSERWHDGGCIIPEWRQSLGVGRVREIRLDVVADFPDIVLGDAAGRRAGGPVATRTEQRLDLCGFGNAVLAISVHVEAVDDDPNDIGLAEQSQRDREPFRGLDVRHGEASHEAGRLALALGVDLADVVELPAVARVVRDQLTAFGTGEHGNQIGLAGLARSEHADAHF